MPTTEPSSIELPTPLANRFVRCIVGFGVAVAVGSAPFLGNYKVPYFPALLELYPESMRESLIAPAAFLMGLVALVTQFASGERLRRGRISRWFLLALGVVLGGFVSLVMMYDDRVLSVPIESLGVTRKEVIAPERLSTCPCSGMSDVECVRETFDPSRIPRCWGDREVKHSKRLLRIGYLTMIAGFGALIGLLVLQEGLREQRVLAERRREAQRGPPEQKPAATRRRRKKESAQPTPAADGDG